MQSKFLSFFLFLAILMRVDSAGAQPQNMDASQWRRPILYGQVDFTYIRLYIPKQIHQADKLLRDNKIKQATPLLKAEAIQHEDDLGAYAEWIQADETIWPQQAAHQENLLQRNPKDLHAAFKLSVILLYQWYERKSSAPGTRDLERARSLMRQVWDSSHHTLAGLFLVEMASRPTYRFQRRWNMTEDILAQILGPEDLAAYQEAKRKNWHSPPPPMHNLSGEELRLLYGIVLNFRTLNDVRVSMAIYKDGKRVGTKDDITEQQTKDLHTYADNWCLTILRITDKEWKRIVQTSTGKQ